ncbi:calcium/calmodulin-dependent protein kinase type 1D isoform X1 [Manduca sexta]|uniref:calcium/calmodulin-dependent protein kinase type 1D isoform X1 n=1 Tax=Manduca sexta TaxID=7130 RepID=UPI00188E53E6|nr:calcium/calmodulin-dependent protein kinase type 1D isoform X1 [Manduca sexta]
MIHVDETDPVGEIEPPFPYRDVTVKRNTDVNDFFEMLSEIGRGKFGTVYLCREKSTGLELAAKLVSVNRRDERRNVEREVEVMRRLRHPRLIQLYDAYDWGKYMCVVLELITGGELFERVIDEDFVLTERACTVFMRQICEGIEFVHRQNILHLDMKPENILCLTKSGNRIKIIDFGLARFYIPEKKLQVLFGTPEFVAPEVVNFDQIGYGTDMWSVGVICYVLLSGLSPFMGETDIETMANVTVAKYDFDDEAFNEISEDAKDFIQKLLVKDKESRPSATECLRHKWLVKRSPVKAEPQPRPEPSPKHELDVAKDNLRLFVERWSEHPNSPYVFDNQAHEITCLANCERSSIGGCSPSPRSSLSSSPDIVFGEDDLEPPPLRDNTFLGPSTRYNPVERRASDSSCFLHKKHDVLVRKNLAEEIKKLSDHLFMLSTMNTDLTNNNSMKEVDKNVTETKEITEEKLPNGFKKETKSTTTKTMVNGDASKKEKKLFTSKSTTKISTSFLTDREAEKPMTSKMPWVKSTRSKRITTTSRDVPEQPVEVRNTFFQEFDKRREKIDKLVNGTENGRQLPYRRGDVNNAHRTKDLLLHLLEKWGETEEVEAERTAGGTSNGGRHKSISLDRSPSNQLAQNSISSLHAFFQRQTSDEKTQRKKTEVTNLK